MANTKKAPAENPETDLQTPEETQTAKQTKANTKPADWMVADTTCDISQERPRRHEIVINGRPFAHEFEYGKGTPMPEAHARKFVQHPEFIVLDPDGERVLPTISAVRGFTGMDDSLLKEEECIAIFEELTTKALVERAQPFPGGENYTAKTPREEIIAFLKKARVEKLNLSKDASDDGEMADDEAKRILASAA